MRFRLSPATVVLLAIAGVVRLAVSAAEPPLAPLVVDPDYAPLLEDTGGGLVTCAILRDTNEAVIGGTFEFVNDTAHRYLAAVRIDGSLDPAFARDGGPDGPVHALLERADGAMVAGGAFRHYAGQFAAGLVGLKADGSIDPSFRAPTQVNGVVTRLAPLPDGRLLVGGSFDQFGADPAPGLVRLLADGTRDDTFRPAIVAEGLHNEVLSIAVFPDGGCAVVVRHDPTRVRPLDDHTWPSQGLAPVRHELYRLRPDGSVEPGFSLQRSTDLEPEVVAVLPSGRLMLAGSGELVRVEADGRIDGRFRFQEQRKMQIRALLPLDEDRLLVAGDVWGDATLAARLMIVGRIGWVEERFLMPRDETHAFETVVRNHSGRILAGGRVAPAVERLSFSKTENRVLLLGEKLGIDRRFRVQVGAPGMFGAAALDGGGGLTLAGSFKSGEGLTGTSITRLQPDGTRDRRFEPTGRLLGLPHVLVPIPDGGAVVAGIVNTDIAIRTPRPVMRLRGDGTADPDFIPDIPITGLFTDGTLLRDGTVVLVGALAGRTPDRNFADLIRFNLAGKVDRRLAETVPSWLSSTSGRILSVVDTASGHLLVGGEFSSLQSYPRSAIARVGSVGVVDPAFVPATEDFAVVAAITPLNDRRTFIDGWAKPTADRPIARRFARLLENGARDPSYAPPAAFGAREALLARVLSDGTTLVVLEDFAPDAPVRFRLARLDRDGSVLPDFDVTLGNYASNLKILPAANGAVYLIGDVPALNGAPRHGLARLVPGR